MDLSATLDSILLVRPATAFRRIEALLARPEIRVMRDEQNRYIQVESFIEGRVMELEDQIGRAEVIDISKLGGTSVKFGATVTLVDEDTDEKRKYQIVGDVESDAKKGRISLSSPIARALIGKSKGDTVEVAAPGGLEDFEHGVAVVEIPERGAAR